MCETGIPNVNKHFGGSGGAGDSRTQSKADRGSQESDAETFVSQTATAAPSKEGGAGASRGEVLKKDKANFLQELQLFHDRNGMGGWNVDSHRLYSVVVAQNW
ncbi:uncharacterized protein LOC119769288 [Culex quinquefasciatus]|uniref:uncharacterized protein LOC119769288 n=1 Tax=Culex quinquefasciatus TaxID=7176 RepID=UPI0018E2F644|nr:uncharacterized protein LOC119769288 [Culex quinquefasciatus]